MSVMNIGQKFEGDPIRKKSLHSILQASTRSKKRCVIQTG
jgi:hypothetical protein